MSGPKLSTYVDVVDADGESHCFGPGDDLPQWALDEITNPDVWADGSGVGDVIDQDQQIDDGADDDDVTDPDLDGDADADGDDDSTDDDDETGATDEPPRSGKGFTRAAWQAHAEDLGITVTDDMDRPAIIAAVDALKDAG